MPTHNVDPASPEGIAKWLDSFITTLRQGTTLSKDTKTDFANLLKEVKPYVLQDTKSKPNSPQVNTNDGIAERFNNLEKKIDELKASLTNSKTCAQVVSAAPPPQQQANSIKRDQL